MADTSKSSTTSKDDSGSFVSQDTFANPHEKALANTQTATDANGVERIVSGQTGGFIPAPLEASKEEIEAAKRRNEMFDKASKDRLAALTGDIKDEDRAVNNPADGGSQSTTITQKEADAKASAAKEAENQ